MSTQLSGRQKWLVLGALGVIAVVASIGTAVFFGMYPLSGSRRWPLEDSEVVWSLDLGITWLLWGDNRITNNVSGTRPLPSPIWAPQGKELASWRFSEMMKEGCVFSEEPQFLDHWMAESNARIRAKPSYRYCLTPIDFKARTTNVVAVVGPNSSFDPVMRPVIADIAYDSILLVTVNGTGAHWMAPYDVDIDWIEAELGRGGARLGIDDRGFHAVYADGTTLLLKKTTPFRVLKPYLLWHKEPLNDRDTGPLREYVLEKFPTRLKWHDKSMLGGALRPAGL